MSLQTGIENETEIDTEIETEKVQKSRTTAKV